MKIGKLFFNLAQLEKSSISNQSLSLASGSCWSFVVWPFGNALNVILTRFPGIPITLDYIPLNELREPLDSVQCGGHSDPFAVRLLNADYRGLA